MKNFKLWGVALAVCLFGAGCSDDDEIEEVKPVEPEIPALIEGARDVLNGINSVILTEDKLDKVKLFTKRKVLLKHKEHKFLDFVVENEGDHQVLKTVLKNKPALKDFPLTCKLDIVIPRLLSKAGGEEKDLEKSVYVSVQNSKPVPDSPTVTYARKALGMGIHTWNDVGDVTHPIFSFESIYWDCSAEEVLNPESFLIEVNGEKYTESMETIGGGLGFSGLFKKQPAAGSKKKAFTLSGGAQFNVTTQTDKIDDYEFYMSYFKKKMSTIKMDINTYAEKGLYSILTPTMNNILNNPTSKAYQTYPNTKEGIFALLGEYGTHIITKGEFGGCYTVVFGRKSSAYTESITGQASASLRTAFPAGSSSGSGSGDSDKKLDWVDVYLAKTQTPNFNIDFNIQGGQKDIDAATGAFYIIGSKGGNASKDMDLWDKSIDATDGSKVSWSVISYATADDKDGKFVELKDPRMVLDADRLKALETYWDEYLDFSSVEAKGSPMVISDFKMVKGGNNHQKGDPKPFVDTDPYGVKRIYFPLMANKNAPGYHGYALETSSDDFVVATDNVDHYWYYSLSHYDPTKDSERGIVDITFSNKDIDGYTQRGNHANDGIPGSLDNNYVYIKYADSKTKYEDVIKAIGLKTNGKVIASTGGAEMRQPFSNQEYLNEFNAYWGNNEYVVAPKSPNYYTGILVTYNKFKPIYSKQPLTRDFTTRGGQPAVSHPKFWGE